MEGQGEGKVVGTWRDRGGDRLRHSCGTVGGGGGGGHCKCMTVLVSTHLR